MGAFPALWWFCRTFFEKCLKVPEKCRMWDKAWRDVVLGKCSKMDTPCGYLDIFTVCSKHIFNECLFIYLKIVKSDIKEALWPKGIASGYWEVFSLVYV